MRQLLKSLLTASILLIFFGSCKKDKLIEDPSAQLSFSQDSVLFDTVFTSVGSTTKNFRVLNPNNQKIKISSLRLARGASSNYRMNVDGIPGKEFTDIEIPAKDSIYIFVEVTVDPNSATSPFVYQDSIVFETNGNIQDVDLYSIGRNCYLHLPTVVNQLIGGGTFSYSVISSNTTWLSDKPHLVFGYALVDSLHTLTIDPGTQVYFHQNGGIIADQGACLRVMGTQAQRVTFQGDRLEPEYRDLPGSWERIWILDGSNNNEINYAVIKNAFIGIQTEPFIFYDSNSTILPGKKVKIHNTIIQNCSYAGILSRYFNIEAGNNVISNCGKYLAALIYGGSYSFRHCTFANYWTADSRSTPSVLVNNYTAVQTIPIDSAYFENCIIDGNIADELQLDSANAANSYNHVWFSHCIIKTQQSVSSPLLFNSILQNGNPSFVDPSVYNFKLNNNSSAIDYGLVLPNYSFDIDGNPRVGAPDIGAYEYH